MAIPSGSGSEVLKNIMWEDATSSSQPTLTLVQHHIYTILSATICNVDGSNSGVAYMYLEGYDSYGSANSEDIRLFRTSINAMDTFVFNDRIVIHGQGSNSAVQKIKFGLETVSFDIVLSYIDQDWT